MKNFILLFTCLAISSLSAQVITVDPAFPNQNDTVTVTFDATQGNGALKGVVPVYAHTGLITSASTGPTNWQHVQGNWGTADSKVLMTRVSQDIFEIKYHIPTFYGFPSGTQVQKLAFVFRNTNGSTVGRAADGSDIFYDVFPANAGLLAAILKPTSSVIATQNQSIEIKSAANKNTKLSLYDNGVLIASDSNVRSLDTTISAGSAGNHLVELVADDGVNVQRDTIFYTVNPTVPIAAIPSGIEEGINIINDSTVTLLLHAPFKNFIYVLGDFNDWRPDVNYFMNKNPAGNNWWITLTGLDPNKNHAFQYWVDGEIKIADPYSELVLDPFNDGSIPQATFPNIPDYPTGKTSGIITWLRTKKPVYNWQNKNYTPPAKEEMVVYELLVRDFVAAHDYQTLIDTLDYLDNLGINAIELMPVNEFEGNESWGYNPSFHMALDKYYGSPLDYKEFIDSCHGRGIAVIMDMALNHAFGQSPLVQLYFDPTKGSFGQPTSQSPWFNEVPKHDFNVGFDFNHESQATERFVKKVMQYWIREFDIDGYRMDLSKGFTQKNSLGNVGLWGQFDQSRIDILDRIRKEVEQVNPNAAMILEHFADNNEETELSKRGFMLWGNLVNTYNEATMGFLSNSDFKWGVYKERGWPDKHLVTYMESHDEQRLMYKNLQFGNSSGNYDIKNLTTALARIELASAFFFPIPGPKMMWQFGELGYDVDIDNPCRVCNKPIRWNYFSVPARRRLYNITSEILYLRDQHPVFNTDNFIYDFSGATKRLNLDGTNMDVTIIGNFDVVAQDAFPQFQNTGWWYEYFSGDSINVTNVNDPINLMPGEYRLYTDVKLSRNPNISLPENAAVGQSLQLYPNPTAGMLHLELPFGKWNNATLKVYNAQGQKVKSLRVSDSEFGAIRTFNVSELPSGVYLLKGFVDGEIVQQKFVLRQ